MYLPNFEFVMLSLSHYWLITNLSEAFFARLEFFKVIDYY